MSEWKGFYRDDLDHDQISPSVSSKEAALTQGRESSIETLNDTDFRALVRLSKIESHTTAFLNADRTRHDAATMKRDLMRILAPPDILRLRPFYKNIYVMWI
jgi:hypothetical protein